MAGPANVLVPLAVVGAALLVFGSASTSAVSASTPLVPPGRSPRFRMVMGCGSRVYYMPVELDASELVLMCAEVRQDRPAATRVRLSKGSRAEDVCLAERPEQILQMLGVDPKQFIVVHQPLGVTAPRTGSEWEDEPSMELLPIWINRSHIEKIGPSPVLHAGRRRLGKLYLRDGLDLELYESLSDLQRLVGPEVPVIKEKWRSRPKRL